MSTELSTMTRPDFAAPSVPGKSNEQMQLLNQYVTPPRLKVMQSNRKGALKELFDEADVAAMPMQQLIVSKDESFLFTPLFFFPEWIVTNPMELGGNMIRDRSFDVMSEIAQKARDPNRRSEPHPEVKQKNGKDMFVRYVECLVFVCMIDLPEEHPLNGFSISFSFARSEHKVGTKLSSLIKMRKVEEMFTCQFEGKVGPRKNDLGEWWGLDVDNPTKEGASPWVSRMQYDSFKELAAGYAKAYAAKVIKVEYDDGDLEDDTMKANSEM